MPRRSLLILFPLYLAQGLPYGFQITALPIMLRERGVSLVGIGFAGFLTLPWLGKALWAPLVDRWGSNRFGHYKSWIVPLQLLMTIAAFCTALVTEHLWPLMAGILVLNLFAATQDIAVDGLAVRTLAEKELGPANAIQVVGYKAGMLIGGGLLVASSAQLGWRGVFFGMGAILSLITLISFFGVHETHATDTRSDAPKKSFKEILSALLDAAKRHGAGFLLLVAGYKVGETMIDVMFKPFLVDSHFSAAQIGLWLGTYGMIASLAGSAFGGFLGRYAGIERTLLLAAFLRIPSLFGQFWLTLSAPTAEMVIAMTVAEHVFGGMLTTAMFALMMKRTERSIGATHYTLLASLEVLGKSPGNWASGFIAQQWGYSVLCATGVALSLIYGLFAAWFLSRAKITGTSSTLTP